MNWQSARTPHGTLRATEDKARRVRRTSGVVIECDGQPLSWPDALTYLDGGPVVAQVEYRKAHPEAADIAPSEALRRVFQSAVLGLGRDLAAQIRALSRSPRRSARHKVDLDVDLGDSGPADYDRLCQLQAALDVLLAAVVGRAERRRLRRLLVAGRDTLTRRQRLDLGRPAQAERPRCRPLALTPLCPQGPPVCTVAPSSAAVLAPAA